jgi:hypothetical protein
MILRTLAGRLVLVTLWTAATAVLFLVVDLYT